MSTYIYALRAPSNNRQVKIRTPKGKLITVAVCGSVSYLYKPYRSWSSEHLNKPFERALDQLARKWGNKKKPMVVAGTDSDKGHVIRVGQPVFAYRYAYMDGRVGRLLRQYPLAIDDESPAGFGLKIGVIEEVISPRRSTLKSMTAQTLAVV